MPHEGCPQNCSFCNQRRISGTPAPPTPEEVRLLLQRAAADLGARVQTAQIAFFGGSFTAIARPYMQALLQTAADAVRRFGFMGIRCSTRPDAVGGDIPALLKRYGVTAVELGAQSMDDAVLCACKRGHTAEDVRSAAACIHAHGFELGLQMMTGLPGDTPEKSVETMRALLALSPDTMRIYPTVVLENTALCDAFHAGTYTPQTLDEAVALCALLLQMAEQAGVRVIRVGLHASEALENRVAGPYHPAFRELCESRIFLDTLRRDLEKRGIRETVVHVAPKRLSAALGQRRGNLAALSAAGYKIEIQPDGKLSGKAYTIHTKDGKACF